MLSNGERSYITIAIALTDKGAVYAWGCGYKDNRRGIVPPVLGLGDNNGRTDPERYLG
jgi:hypothetical protein